MNQIFIAFFLMATSAFATDGNSHILAKCTGRNVDVEFFVPHSLNEVLVNVEQTSPYALVTLGDSQINTENVKSRTYKRKANGLDIELKLGIKNRAVDVDNVIITINKVTQKLDCR